jgi:hypothetical protein
MHAPLASRVEGCSRHAVWAGATALGKGELGPPRATSWQAGSRAGSGVIHGAGGDADDDGRERGGRGEHADGRRCTNIQNASVCRGGRKKQKGDDGGGETRDRIACSATVRGGMGGRAGGMAVGSSDEQKNGRVGLLWSWWASA